MHESKMAGISRALEKYMRLSQIVLVAVLIIAVVAQGILTLMYLSERFGTSDENNIDISGEIAAMSELERVLEPTTYIDVGPIRLEVDGAYAPDKGNTLAHGWLMVGLAEVLGAVMWYAVGIFRRILRPMGEGRPFSPSTGREIRRLAFASLAAGVVQNGLSVATTANSIHAFGLEKLLLSDSVQSVSANYKLDMTFLLLFFVLLLMSHIFNYGAELQKLSDETL